MDPIANVTTEQVILEKLRVASMQRVGASVRHSVKAEQLADLITGEVAFQLEAEVLAERLTGDTATATIRFPSSWFQHIKRDQWYVNLHKDRIMRWAARRWPVRYTTHTVTVSFERYAKFPHATIVTPELGRPVIFERFTEPWWSDDSTGGS